MGDVGRFSIVYFHWSNNETTSDHEEILDGDSLQRGEHFYGVGFLIPQLDFIVQVGMCFS